MRRREFLSLIGGAAAWPLAARAQQPGRTYRLGFLLPTARQTPPVQAFFDELRLNGFVEGQNLSVIPGGFEAIDGDLAERAAALAKAAPDAIIAGPKGPLLALQAITRTVPLIGMSEDMVGEGLAASLARPGGNITGISLLSPELDGKRQDILIEAVAGARRIAAMVDPRASPPFHVQVLQQAARSRGVELATFEANGPEQIVSAIDAAKAAGAQALNFGKFLLDAFKECRLSLYALVDQKTCRLCPVAKNTCLDELLEFFLGLRRNLNGNHVIILCRYRSLNGSADVASDCAQRLGNT